MALKSSLGTSLPAVGASAIRSAGEVWSPDSPPVIGLGQDEREVYDYICDSLRSASIEHVTAGTPIAIIVRTFIDWIGASRGCEEKGRLQTSKSGWSTNSVGGRRERLRWSWANDYQKYV